MVWLLPLDELMATLLKVLDNAKYITPKTTTMLTPLTALSLLAVFAVRSILQSETKINSPR